MTIKLTEILSQLPQDAQVWIEGMDFEERLCTEIILNDVGQESFTEHWQVHRDRLQYIGNM